MADRCKCQLVASAPHLLSVHANSDWRAEATRFLRSPPLLTSATAALQAACSQEGFAVSHKRPSPSLGLASGFWFPRRNSDSDRLQLHSYRLQVGLSSSYRLSSTPSTLIVVSLTILNVTLSAFASPAHHGQLRPNERRYRLRLRLARPGILSRPTLAHDEQCQCCR